MTIQIRNIPVSFWIRSSVRYLLVSHGFRLIQAVVVLTALSFVLTGSRIVAIDRYGNRADIVAAIVVTIVVIALLTALNRRVMNAIDRRFFREAYNAELVLTELGEAIPTLSKTSQLVELVADKISDALHPENVTIFLDDEEAGAYVAVFSINALTTSPESGFGLRHLVLHYDDGLIDRLRKTKRLDSLEFAEVDFSERLHHQGIVSGRSENQTLLAVRSSLLILSLQGICMNSFTGQRLSDLPYAGRQASAYRWQQIATFIENINVIVGSLRKGGTRADQMAAEVQRHLSAAGLENNVWNLCTCLPALGIGGGYYDYFETTSSASVAIADVAGRNRRRAVDVNGSGFAALSTHFKLVLEDVVSSMIAPATLTATGDMRHSFLQSLIKRHVA